MAQLVCAEDKIKLKVPLTGKTYQEFIPKGYDTMIIGPSIARGDLNKDGLEDIALVLRNIEETKYDTAIRYVVIIFKQQDGYRLACIAGKVVMSSGDGGVWGEPFDGVRIKKRVLIISHYGGSNWRWSVDMKFRYQDGDFYLIGETRDYYWTMVECGDIGIGDAGRNYVDINYVTGDRYRRKTTEDCKVLLNKKDKIKIKPLINMVDAKAIDN